MGVVVSFEVVWFIFVEFWCLFFCCCGGGMYYLFVVGVLRLLDCWVVDFVFEGDVLNR